MYTLNEPTPGICPVCRVRWSTDPRLECDCTRAQPNDDAQATAAYQKSASCRVAKLAADALEARRTSAPIRRQPQRLGNVVPITRAPARRRLGAR